MSTAAPTVVCFGSLNRDCTYRVSERECAALADAFEWFPATSETVTVADPSALRHGSGETSDADGVSGLDGTPDAVALGGKGANQAYAAAVAGADVRMAGRVGPDAADLTAPLAAVGVDLDLVDVAREPTGTAHVWVTPDAENRIAIVPGANGVVDAEYAASVADAAVAADVVCLQNEVPVEAGVALLDRVADLANESGTDDRPLVVVDPAPVANAAPLVAHDAVDVVTPNAVEAAALTDALRTVDGVVVRTRGADGAAAVVSGVGTAAPIPGAEPSRSFAVPAPTVRPRDTTGAGDAFTGCLAAELARATALEPAVRQAVVAATLSVTRSGARAAPRRARVQAVRGNREWP